MRTNIPRHNPITDHGATLGRVLFYDRRLSVNNTTACASCHLQEYAFSTRSSSAPDSPAPRRREIPWGWPTGRFFQADHFFWDARVKNLEELALLPIQSPIEMGSTLDQVVAKIAASPFYPPLFAKAFGSPEVNPDRIAKALAQFIRAMVSYQSRYDEGVATGFFEISPGRSALAWIFSWPSTLAVGCATKRTRRSSISRATMDSTWVYADKGVGSITGDGFDHGRFKPPSLRNVALTARTCTTGGWPPCRMFCSITARR